MTDIAIAGSGLSGLACAATLAGRTDCLVVERLPVVGGEEWANARIGELARRAMAGGARVVTGTQAIRWDGERVTMVGQDSRVQTARVLVVATGHRPQTRGELSIGGDRCGGVLPGTVAMHLMDRGVTIGHRPLVVGEGSLALALARQLIQRGGEVHLALPSAGVLSQRGHDMFTDSVGVHRYIGAVPIWVSGENRVGSVRLRWGDGRVLDVVCDALILAHGRIPYRNVDGAIFDAPGVLFAQSGKEDLAMSERCGRDAAEAALDLVTRPASEFAVPLRVGVPA
jgi:D-hydroxyproline dehydrogenase subunit alpha